MNGWLTARCVVIGLFLLIHRIVFGGYDRVRPEKDWLQQVPDLRVTPVLGQDVCTVGGACNVME